MIGSGGGWYYQQQLDNNRRSRSATTVGNIGTKTMRMKDKINSLEFLLSLSSFYLLIFLSLFLFPPFFLNDFSGRKDLKTF